MADFPARADDCSLEYIQTDPSQFGPTTPGQVAGQSQFGPTSPWQLVGYVSVDQGGTADPFSERYRQIVRPRACAMGGEAVTLIMAEQAPVGLGTTNSDAIYGVLRRRSHEPQAPRQF